MPFVDILVRPVLLVIRAVRNIIRIQAWGGFMNILLSVWLKALGSTNPSFGPVAQIVYSAAQFLVNANGEYVWNKISRK